MTAAILTEGLPGLTDLDAVTVVGRAPAEGDEAVGYTVAVDGAVPASLGLDREALTRAGFDGKVGQTLVIATPQGPDLIAVGVGDPGAIDAAGLRDAAAAFARATARRARIALVIDEVTAAAVPAREATAALAEGAALARYRYRTLKSDPAHVALTELALALPDDSAVAAGASAALVSARAAVIARDLANTPPNYVTATRMGQIAEALGERHGFEVEVFDKAALTELGCGGLLGVNRGSAEEPRMIKLSYRPAGAASAHLGLVGKGIMYDSGGISLKPSDPMHLLMKMDMGGAAAVLGAVAGLRDTGAKTQVTAWLMCTDNMPSGTAYKLGDVLVARGGTTVEVKNTDAEGRLVMMDALALAVEEGVDAIIDIATLTGAALAALGPATAPVLGNDQRVIDLVRDAASQTDEPVWQLPLEAKYRTQLDSDVADISNLGGKYAGATTAALFLEHFVGDTPWAHIDIAGTMQTETDDAWRSKGATGFGARLLLSAAAAFTAPSAAAPADQE